jgi:predicted TPR repeat methyltransferase
MSRKTGRRPVTDSTRKLLAEGIDLHRKGNATAACEIYRKVLTSSPNYPDALHFLGVAEHQLGHSDAALKLITRAVTLNPSYQDAHNNLGNVYKQIGRLDDAEASYRRALELKPEDANALSNLGTVRREQGDLDGAIHYFRAVIGLSPTHAEAWQNLGNALGALHRYDEALDAHKEALRLRPRSSDSYRYLGAMFATLGRVQEATEIYRQWLEISPNDPQALHMLAACTGESIPERASDEFVRHLFDKFASSFDKNLARLEYQAPKLVLEAVSSVYSERTGSLDVLDAGCGTGLCGPLLRPYARQLSGVDLSQLMVERAKERKVYDELFVEELTQYLSRSHSAYDLIVSADTLVYFGNLKDVVKASISALKPSGSFVFTVEQCPKDLAPKGFRLEPHGRYSHVKDYVDQELRDAGYSSTTFESVTLRKEAGKWVSGWLVTARV